MKTVSIDLLAGQSRGDAPNLGTLAMKSVVPRFSGDFRKVFCAQYEAFASDLRAIDEPGVAVIAVDEARGRLAGILRLAARPGRVTGGILGRHGCADLFLDGCDALSLRQLAILLEPPRSWRHGSAEISYRVVDLRTGTGFTDERGRQLVGVRCEGSAFFRCGPFALMMLAVGDAADWPERAEDAWEMIPERVFFDEQSAFAAGRARAVGIASWDGRGTAVMATRGPHLVHEVSCGGLAAVGDLQIGVGGAASFAVSDEALHEGLLVGRYPRCLGAELVDDEMVSRTHLLLIKVGGRVCALDTGSTNGTWCDGAEVRLVELQTGARLRLGRDTEIVWRERS